MSCVDTDGALTFEALGILRLLAHPGTAEKVALCEGRPLQQVRDDLRDLEESGLIARVAGAYRTTSRGEEAAAAAPRVDPIC